MRTPPRDAFLQDIQEGRIDKADGELGLKREEIVRGASYLYELILISIMRHLEGLVPNHNVHDVIQWSHSDMRDKAIDYFDYGDIDHLLRC